VKSIQLNDYGSPAEVVTLTEVADVGEPEPDEIVIDVEATSVEPSDLYVIAGRYGKLPPLPHILGIQGVGRVTAVGRDVQHLSEGDRALIPPFTPSWVERVKTNATWLRPLPDADLHQLSMLGINPATAYLIMTEFVHLEPGDWLIQNAANSSVGRAVIAIARARGIKTVNVVRRPDVVGVIEELGGDVVLVDGPDLAERVASATGNASITLGLDGVGGEDATQGILNSVVVFGTVVVWSGMGGPFTVSGSRLLFFDQTIRGFWIYNYFQAANPDKLTAMYEELATLVASGALIFPVAGEYRFDEHLAAIGVAEKYSGKAILVP
jgi:NADPH:quinone reductase-like Zn-dependent oxidoreductase